MQATARRLSVVSATSTPRRRLIRDVRRIATSLVNESEEPKSQKLTTRRLLVVFFLAFIACSLFRTPGSWSDGGSQWFPSLLLAPVSLAFCIATHWIYIRPGRAPKVQAAILWVIFGVVFTVSVIGLIQSQHFLSRYHRPGPFDYLRHPSHFFDAPWGNF